MGQWGSAASLAARREVLMASKNTRGRNTKTAATKSLKEKRAAKKAKRAGKAGAGNDTMDRAFDR